MPGRLCFNGERIEANPSKPVSLVTIKGLGYKLAGR